MIGSILYGFSGFMAVNMIFYHFLDAVAFFPLLLIGVEMVMDARKLKKCQKQGWIIFTIGMFLNCSTNYYFFAQDLVILVLYFLFRYFDLESWKEFMACFLRFLAAGALGTCMAAAVFLPSALYILNNTRSKGVDSSVYYARSVFYDIPHMMLILKGIMFPTEAMLDSASAVKWSADSTSAFLPFVGITFVISYIVSKRDRISAFILLLIAISFSPIANASFAMFTIVYQRWWYLLVLMMTLATVRVLNAPMLFRERRAAGAQFLLMSAYVLLSYFLRNGEGSNLIFHVGRMTVLVLITAMCSLVAVYLTKHWSWKSQQWMMMLVCACVLLTHLSVQYEYHRADEMSPDDYHQAFDVGQALPAIEDEYRYRNYHNLLMVASTQENTNGLSSYSSTAANHLQTFDDLFDYYKIDNRMNKNLVPGVAELLGGKYEYQSDNLNVDVMLKSRENKGKVWKDLPVNGRDGRIIELPACPIGFSMDAYITESDIRKLAVNERGIALLRAAVVSDADEKLANGAGLKRITDRDVKNLILCDKDYSINADLFQNKAIRDLTKQNSKHRVSNFQKDYHGFSCRTAYEEQKAVYFSICNDEGWDIRIDGEPTKPIDSAGMILLSVQAGEHRITAEYHTPGLTGGMVISAAAWLLFAFICLGWNRLFRLNARE